MTKITARDITRKIPIPKQQSIIFPFRISFVFTSTGSSIIKFSKMFTSASSEFIIPVLFNLIEQRGFLFQELINFFLLFKIETQKKKIY